MGEFFNGWRRKVGLVTLVIACLLATGWVRSCRYYDLIWIQDQNASYFVYSMDGTVSVWWLSGRRFVSSFGWVSSEITNWEERGGHVSYWSLVLPLTLLSAWLILIKPRKAKGSP